MKKNVVVAILCSIVFSLGTVSAEGVSEQKAFAMPHSHVVPIKESTTGRQYELYVKLPQDYAKNPDKKYPVIYMTDGGWNMLPLAGTTAYLMTDVVLVGISWQKDIDRTRAYEFDGEWVHASRYRDYTLTKWSNPDEQAVYEAGQAKNHLSFIREEIIPYVEKHYRVDPNERAFFGYSLGGSFGAYILFAEPDTFKHYILGSPALGRASLRVINDLASQIVTRKRAVNANVFVTIGEQEETEMKVTNDFISVLKRSSQSGIKYEPLQVIANSDHTTAVPETVMRGIKWLVQQTAE